jgi:hypothetical protein
MATATGSFTNANYRLRLEVNQSSQSIANNQSVVSYALYAERLAGSGFWSSTVQGSSSVTINGSAIGGPAWNYDFRNSSTTPKLIMSGSRTVGHNSDGTLTISFSGAANSASSIGSAGTNSGSLGLTTIPRTSNVTLSSGTFEAGSAVTINTNRASTSFTHTAAFSFGSTTGTIATGVATSVAWTPPLSLLTQIPNGLSGVGTITLTTFSGSTNIGSSSINFTLTAGAAIVPTFSAVTATENVTLVSTEVGAFVQTLTRLNVAIVGAAGVQGSTISTATITVAGQTISSLTGLTAPIATSGTLAVVGTITDSRARTATRTLNITVLPYIPPTLNPALMFARRSDSVGVLENEGTFIRVDINAVVQSLIVSTQRNTLTYRVSTRLRGTVPFTVRTTVAPGGIAFNNFVVLSDFATTSSFDVLVEVFDKFNTGALQFAVATAAVFMHWGAGLGMGKFYETGRGSVDAIGQMFQNDGLAVVDVGDVATASARGVVELATNTEANAATDTSKAVTPSGLAVLKSDVANALARTKNIAVVDVDTTIRTAGTSWTLGPTFSTISGFKANSWVKLFYHVPSRNQSGSWGGIYIEPQVSWNGAAYQSLGGTGFENMVLNGEEILTFNNTLLLDPGFASVFSARFRFYFRSYDGTTGWGNSNRNINTVSGTASMMTGDNGIQHYPHIVVEEITR